MEKHHLTFGSNVKRLRELRSLSQEELASLSSSHRNYIGGIERGERNPTLSKIVQIASALECSLGDLLRDIK
jgi:transcriptional regulator with XRE-family HTH domain